MHLPCTTSPPHCSLQQHQPVAANGCHHGWQPDRAGRAAGAALPLCLPTGPALAAAGRVAVGGGWLGCGRQHSNPAAPALDSGAGARPWASAAVDKVCVLACCFRQHFQAKRAMHMPSSQLGIANESVGVVEQHCHTLTPFALPAAAGRLACNGQPACPPSAGLHWMPADRQHRRATSSAASQLRGRGEVRRLTHVLPAMVYIQAFLTSRAWRP